MNEENIVVCRCEDITLRELREAIKEGYDSWDKLKRYLRIGMGPCGGKTCRLLVLRELAMVKNVPISKLYVRKTVVRPPVRSVPFNALEKEASL
ncbi:MAG TPA: (2Fe-2S)-binding protein [Coprothermobacter proteolyticus]|nr:(2Fe-2S)-binding protein [Coprothermobacter proteolyticus]